MRDYPAVMFLMNRTLTINSHLPERGELRILQGRTDFSALILSGSLSLTDEELCTIPPLPCLEAMSLSHSLLRGPGLRHLQRHPNLEQVDLSYTRVQHEGLAELCQLAKLSKLTLDHSRLDDAGLLALTGCAVLRDLAIRGTQVTEAGVKSLRALKALRILEVSGLPYKVVEAARKHLPGVKVNYPEEVE